MLFGVVWLCLALLGFSSHNTTYVYAGQRIVVAKLVIESPNIVKQLLKVPKKGYICKFHNTLSERLLFDVSINACMHDNPGFFFAWPQVLGFYFCMAPGAWLQIAWLQVAWLAYVLFIHSLFC